MNLDDSWRDSVPAQDRPDDLEAVLESASRLQLLVPDAVLVGGSAAALFGGHRTSFDHDHVVADLRDRFDMVLEAIEREGDWVTNRITPGKIILGELGGIEAGVRQLIRARPLETQEVTLRSGHSLRVPTAAETLRIKAFLVIKRNQVRDYLDVAGLSSRYGTGPSAAILSNIDDYYDSTADGERVASQVARQLAQPRPKDSRVTASLSSYKNLHPRWQNWASVLEQVRTVAREMDLGEEQI